MSSSGTDTFTVNRDAMTTASLRVLRVIQDGQVPTTQQLNDGAQAMNMLLKNWQSKGLIVSKVGQIVVPCVANQQSYTIGPSGADVTSVRPLMVLDGTFIRKGSTDTTLRNIKRQEYEQVSAKASAATTNAVYYFPGINIAGGVTSPGTGWGTLFLLYPSVDNTYSIYLNTLLPVYDMTSSTNEIDLPKEWFRAIKFGLAADMADEYEVPEDRIARLMAISDKMLMELEMWQKTLVNIAFGEMVEAQGSYSLELKRQKGAP